ncbi:MAG: DUF1848 family protein [Pseudomonadota bacterium]
MMDKTPPQIVLSASRRSDIPAFYMPWFMDGIHRGAFSVKNPYTSRCFTIPADTASVHSIVFWSKNYGPFLAADYARQLMDQGYHLFFNFTVNTPDALLEPGVPSLAARLSQMADIARRVTPAALQWRFDPIVYYRRTDGKIVNNIGAFEEIADVAAACGVTRCITSFMDHYPKTRRRWHGHPGSAFVDPPLAEKIAVLRWMTGLLTVRGMALYACCESGLLTDLPKDIPIAPASCIPSDLLMGIYGGCLSLARDRGQRRAAGCGCRVARDIGSYTDHPCFHNCRFCYANPAEAPKE